MLYFLKVDSKDWTLEKAKEFFLGYGTNHKNDTRLLHACSEAIVEGVNFLPICCRKAQRLLQQLKKEEKYAKASKPTSPSKQKNVTQSQKNGNFNLNGSNSIQNIVQTINLGQAPEEINAENVREQPSSLKRKFEHEYLEGGEGPVTITEDTNNVRLVL
ncbi:uncharacterized protein EV154DRAFT_560924 [Mucor mucedo]|uniref:uncharacterized protein n=1 Tax=Mucor mucedo TaxID=29922 RepID=UPI00221E881B|nr:uncharacterized protein EV154DRAFT_560924 [Mucor mucedo]KAI7893906.1 hypothetical protein EV154DRAFT_560924 [Mucor mucedo]